MGAKTRALVISACVLAGLLLVAASTPSPVESRIAAQNALFEEQYQSDLKAHPQLATFYGDFRYNDQLDDLSVAAIQSQHTRDEDFLARLNAISTSGFPSEDQVSHGVMKQKLQQRIDDYGLKEYEMPVSQMSGPHIVFADLPLAVPFDSVKRYEDYIARLHQIPHAFTQTEEVLRAGMKDNLMPVRFLLEMVPAQCAGTIAADPFLAPTKKFPSSISAGDQQRLTQMIIDATNNEVLPAYKAFASFIATEYAPHGRTTLAVTSLPGGEGRYLNDIRRSTTVSNLTADEIYQLGLREMDRIGGEMLAIAHQEGFSDLASFDASLAKNPKYIPTSAEQILDDYRKYIGQMQAKLPDLFTYLPGSPVTVEAIPAFQSAMATHYVSGTPDGKRPGRVVVATYDFPHRTLVDDEATAYHEGIPGHHMQRSVAQQMTGLPQFRQHGQISGYGEGWALYAEQLGKEVGFYKDPVSDWGRLKSERFRAVRLVVDTGIHAKGWSREQVVDFFRKSGTLDEPEIQTETDRYIAWPAQALSYKIGQLKFLELRERARKELGTKFDIRTFHDEMLNGGVLPLDLLEARTNSWIQAQKTRAMPELTR